MRSRIYGENPNESALTENKSKIDHKWGKTPFKHVKKENIIIKNKQL